MSQGQPQRPSEGRLDLPVRYGDLFPVTGQLAREPVAPRDAAMMQSAENLVTGHTQKGGAAAAMQAAADRNERAGFVRHDDISGIPAFQGIAVAEADVPGRRVITETVGGQVVGRYSEPTPVATGAPAGTVGVGVVTIGDALESAARTAGDKPVEQSDASAIQAAEVRATGLHETLPGGVAAEAQCAADINARSLWESEKTTLREVLTDAAVKLPADKAATTEDAEKVRAAELRNNPGMEIRPGGVAACVATAARLNENRQLA